MSTASPALKATDNVTPLSRMQARQRRASATLGHITVHVVIEVGQSVIDLIRQELTEAVALWLRDALIGDCVWVGRYAYKTVVSVQLGHLRFTAVVAPGGSLSEALRDQAFAEITFWLASTGPSAFVNAPDRRRAKRMSGQGSDGRRRR